MTNQDFNIRLVDVNNEKNNGFLAGVSLPPSSRPPRVSLAPKTLFPKTPFPFPFKRLPRRLVPPGCDLDKRSEEYRITVPLFGAVSSPCCVNLAMRGNAEDHQHEFSPEVVSTALKNLFVDDSLKSLPSSNESIKYDLL